MAAVYVLARDVAGAPAGVVSALVFGTAPFVAFEHRGWSVVAGLALGLGMLTKPPFAAYVLAPLVLTAARIRSRRAVANLALALLIGGALSLPWYGRACSGFYPRSRAAGSGKPQSRTTPTR